MIYIKNIEIVGNTYPGSHVLKPDFKIDCSDINLFVGDQGCGKSTLLNLLQKNHKDIKLTFSENISPLGVNTFFFDSEHDNPRTKDPQFYTRPNGESIGIGIGGALSTRFMSHGETLQKFIFGPLANVKNCVVILDEPESGLSITNQFRMIKAIEKAVKRGCQFFIATHCYPLIQNFFVISLEHNRQMTGSAFVELVKNKK